MTKLKTKIEIYPNKNFVVDKKSLKKLIFQMLEKINKQFAKIELSFLTDKELFELNKKYLNHNNYTDILTFTYNSDDLVTTEMLISYQRAFENSKKYKCSFEDEILRLIAHGMLHSIGLNDKTKSQKIKMRKAENDLLNSIKRVSFIKKIVME